MKECRELRERLDMLLANKRKESYSSQELLEKEMEERGRREERFCKLASDLYSRIIEPRLIVIQEYYDDAVFGSASLPNSGIVDFNKDRRYSATVQLHLGINSNQSFNMVIIQYRFQVLPIFMQFQSEDALEFPLDDVDETHVTKFVDDKILQSIDTYLRMQEVPQYLQDNMVTDPVCGMRISRTDAISTEHAGKTHYFCAAACKDRFLNDPERYR